MDKLDISSIGKDKIFHFVGIGGISMSGLAEILHDKGFLVQGSDRSESKIINNLKKSGITVFIGQTESNVDNADIVIYTAAIKQDNPELLHARKKNIPMYTRAELLGAIMKEYPQAVGISGTHGKTTTTSILSHAMLKAGTDATISIGGELDLIGGNIKVGKSDYFITEACEYTNSFLKFFPKIAVITNIEEDHLDFFSGIEEIKESFRKFAELTKNKGSVVAYGCDENVKSALSGADLDIHYYGVGCEYHAENIIFNNSGFPEFDVYKNNEKLVHIVLNVCGEHNINNALAAIAVCNLLNLDLNKCAEGIFEFYGTHRRFEDKCVVNGARVIDDYAHHPTEIKATLKAAKNIKHNRLWCIFQPHTYSRTRTLWDSFVTAFDGVDELILADIYAARELPDGVTTSEKLAEEIKKRGIKARYIESFKEIEDIIIKEAKKDDLVLTVGAGNIVDVADDLSKKVRE